MKKYISSILALTISCGVCALPAYAKGAGAENIEIRVNKDNASLYWTNAGDASGMEIYDNLAGAALSLEGISTEDGAENKLSITPASGEEPLSYTFRKDGWEKTVQSDRKKFSFSDTGWRVAGNGDFNAKIVPGDPDGYALFARNYTNETLLIAGERNADFTVGSTYQMKFRYRAKNVDSLKLRIGSYQTIDEVVNGDEWQTAEALFDVTKKNAAISIQPVGDQAEIYLDDVEICLYEGGSAAGENMIVNGDFEESAAPEKISDFAYSQDGTKTVLSWTNQKHYSRLFLDGEEIAVLAPGVGAYVFSDLIKDQVYTASVCAIGANGLDSEKSSVEFKFGEIQVKPAEGREKYQPKNVIMRGSVISWNNPATAPSAIDIYRVENGVSTYLLSGTTLTAGTLTSLDLGEDSGKYRMKFTFPDQSETEYFVQKTDATYSTCNSWRAGFADATCLFELTDQNPKEGKYCFHYFRNTYANTILYYDGDKTKMESGKTYRFSFWYRGSGYTQLNVSVGGGIACEPDANVWKKAEFDFTPESALSELYFQMADGMADIYLDDIQVYLLENGEVTGANLFGNGDFETTSVIGKTTNVSAVSEDGTATISWNPPQDADCVGVNVYLNGDLKGHFLSDQTSVTLSGLENNKKSVVKIVGISAHYEPVGTPVEISVIPEADKYSVGEVVLKNAGGRLSALSAGALTVSSLVKNNQESEKGAQILAALYVDGELVSLSCGEVLLAAGESKQAEAKITVSEEQLANGAVLKVFLLDSLRGKTAIAGKTEF